MQVTETSLYAHPYAHSLPIWTTAPVAMFCVLSAASSARVMAIGRTAYPPLLLPEVGQRLRVQS